MTLVPKNKRLPSSLSLYCTNNYKTDAAAQIFASSQ